MQQLSNYVYAIYSLSQQKVRLGYTTNASDLHENNFQSDAGGDDPLSQPLFLIYCEGYRFAGDARKRIELLQDDAEIRQRLWEQLAETFELLDLV